MHFDMNTMAGRHLVFAYASVILIQGGYFVWIVRNLFALNRSEQKNNEASLGDRASLSEEYRR